MVRATQMTPSEITGTPVVRLVKAAEATLLGRLVQRRLDRRCTRLGASRQGVSDPSPNLQPESGATASARWVFAVGGRVERSGGDQEGLLRASGALLVTPR
jgi:hypothetical protein